MPTTIVFLPPMARLWSKCLRSNRRLVMVLLVLVAVVVVTGLSWSMLGEAGRLHGGVHVEQDLGVNRKLIKDHTYTNRTAVTQRAAVSKVKIPLRHTEHSSRRHSKHSTCHVTHSCPECPDLSAIPNLVNDREMELNESPADQLEQYMCPNQAQEMKDLVSSGSDRLRDRDQSRYTNISSSGQPLALQRLSSLELRCRDYLYLPGGHWKPATCRPKWKVAIVVPYRNRTFHLSIFLRYMVPFLQKQRLEFAIYVVNQADGLAFNRGMLLNIGFLEALNFSDWDCFVFHDVDHLPQSEFNPYGCVDLPRHFIGGADNRKYKVPYSTSFGGVTGFTTAQFRRINGFGNVYWGWGCEDDDLGLRVHTSKLHHTRYKGTVGYYKAIRLHHNRNSTGKRGLEKRNRALLKTFASRLKTDGLSNLRYQIHQLELHTLYTNISVGIQMQV